LGLGIVVANAFDFFVVCVVDFAGAAVAPFVEVPPVGSAVVVGTAFPPATDDVVSPLDVLVAESPETVVCVVLLVPPVPHAAAMSASAAATAVSRHAYC
jgi:hypothetical protein